MGNGYDHHSIHHHHHHFHQKTIFLPMFCRLSVKDITLNNHRKNPISDADDPSSPKVSCMGQIKQNNRVIAFPDAGAGATHHNRYSKLRRLFSSKIPLPPTSSSVSSNSALAGGGDSGSKSFRSGSDVCERDLRRLKLKSDDDDRCGQKDCVKVVNIGELDPPLPVVKKVASPGAGRDEVNLWRVSSLTVGPRGPVLLEDYHLIEKLATFDRERIPERVVHARGASAKGFFEVTHDISHLTCADFLRAPGVQTPVIVRFSTVVHERGSPESLRDIRGFAVKFYTREGNFDLVGNNVPVFFNRDAKSFPDTIRALKPNPKSHIQEYWRILDFFSFLPESLHTFAWFFDDVCLPTDYRHMEGYGVHAYQLINKAGKAHYVKFHWKPTCGVKCMSEEEAIRVGGTNHSHATKDLYDSIAAGNYPEWKLFIQIMDTEDVDKFDFDPLDVTKTWPEDILPLMPVGRLVLNRNIDNFFAENEQLAFNPGHIVPGLYYSEDKLLQTRIFAYADTQRHRIGPNYMQLPVNAPKCAHHNNHRDGAMNFMHRDEEVDYLPSRFDPCRHAEQYPIPSRVLTGRREMCVIEKENNFKQAGERYRSWEPDRQDRYVSKWVEHLSDPRVTYEIRSIWISYLSQADKSCGQKVASRLTLKPTM